MIKRTIEKECEAKPKEEVCGFVVQKDKAFELIPMVNQSPNPKEEFYIPAKEFLYVKKNYEIVAVYHSHVQGGCEPSDFDIKTADLICYPFVIYSNEKNIFYVHEPKYSDANLESLKILKEDLL